MNKQIQISDIPMPTTHLLEAEVLTALIECPYLIPEAAERLSSDSFSAQPARVLWEALNDMFVTKQDIDLPAVYHKTDTGYMQSAILPRSRGGSGFSDSEVLSRIQNLATGVLRRNAYLTGLSLLTSSVEENGVDKILDTVKDFSEKAISSIRKPGTEDITKAINNFAEVLEERARLRAQGTTLRIPTSLPQLDFLTYGGWAPGNLIILAARPSVGKTALALQMAREAATRLIPTLMFPLEMTNAEIVQRLLCSTEHLSQTDIAKGNIDWYSFEAATGRFANVPLYLNDQLYSCMEITHEITVAVQQGRCKLGIIDYLGLMTGEGGKNQSLADAVAEKTKRLKQVAKSCAIPIILLCQLNRSSASEKRSPELYDLRDSGAIEQDADIVLMMESIPEEGLAVGQKSHLVRVWIRKNRQGSCGVIDLRANESFTNFYEI